MDLLEAAIIGLLILVGAASVVIVGLLGFGLYDELTAESFSLRKDAWNCSQSHTETLTTTLLVGKVVIPQTNTTTVCDQWTRK